MNNIHDQLDALRREWQDIKIDNQRLHDTNRRLTQQLASERAAGRQQRVARYYCILGLVSFVGLPVLAVMLREVLAAPVWLAVLYGAIGVCLAALNFGFGIFTGRSDYLSLPVTEAISHARRVLIWQARLRNVGVLLAVCVVVPIFAHLHLLGENSALAGAIIGIVIGLAIGTAMYLRNRRIVRRALRDLEQGS